MAWTRMAEGEDAYATRLVGELGYLGALEWVRLTEARTVEEPGLALSLARWKQRCDHAAFQSDRNRNLLGFLMPGDEHWPAQLDDLGETRPLGLWYRGDPSILPRMGVSVVGSRDSSAYGRKIATDIAYELADNGLNIVSGGALGIDAAAHRGALAADGYTVAVAACGADRFYPASHGNLYLEILRRGGVICSEAPPGAAPLKHRFLSRNRIIAALAAVTVVVEAPYRSGALSSARHALTIGRPVGAVPGPITSPRSVGCHRLLRESAVCVTSAKEVAELLSESNWPRVWRGKSARPGALAGSGRPAGRRRAGGEEDPDVASGEHAPGRASKASGKSSKDPGRAGKASGKSSKARGGSSKGSGKKGQKSGGSNHSSSRAREAAGGADPRSGGAREVLGGPGGPGGRQLELEVSTDPLAARIIDAFPLSRATTAEAIAVVAGLSISEVLSGLGRLERAHAVTQEAGAWRLVRQGRR